MRSARNMQGRPMKEPKVKVHPFQTIETIYSTEDIFILQVIRI